MSEKIETLIITKLDEKEDIHKLEKLYKTFYENRLNQDNRLCVIIKTKDIYNYIFENIKNYRNVFFVIMDYYLLKTDIEIMSSTHYNFISLVYCLLKLKDQYKYFITIPLETNFVKKCKLEDVAIKYYEIPIILYNKIDENDIKMVSDIELINKTFKDQMNFFNELERKIIEIKLKDTYHYNLINIYKSDHLNSFFIKMRMNLENLKEIIKQHEEYPIYFSLIYNYYLITKQYINVYDISSNFLIKETLPFYLYPKLYSTFELIKLYDFLNTSYIVYDENLYLCKEYKNKPPENIYFVIEFEKEIDIQNILYNS